MLTAVKKQLRVCLLSVKYNIMREMLNKVTFITNICFMMLNNASFLVQWAILFRLKEDIGGYSFREVMLLWGLSASSFGLSHILFARVFSLPELVINGKPFVFPVHCDRSSDHHSFCAAGGKSVFLACENGDIWKSNAECRYQFCDLPGWDFQGSRQIPDLFYHTHRYDGLSAGAYDNGYGFERAAHGTWLCRAAFGHRSSSLLPGIEKLFFREPDGREGIGTDR